MTSPLADVQFHLVDSIDSAAALKRWMGERHAGPIAVDTENSGLQPNGPHRDHCRLIQIGDSIHGWTIPYHLWGGVAEELLRAYEGRMVMHNAKYDMSFINADSEVIPWRKVDDNRTLAWLADPQNVTGLKPLAGRYVDAEAPGMQRQLDDGMALNGWDWGSVPIDYPPYWAYAAMDTVLTSRMWDLMAGRVFTDPGLQAAYNLELAVLPVLQRMEARGARVDPARAETYVATYTEQISQWQDWARVAHGISLTSNQQVVRRLQEMGQPLTKRTPGGAYALDKNVASWLLIEGVNDHVRQIMHARRAVNQMTKIIGSYLSKIVASGGTVHSSINPLGAGKTSRMSITQIKGHEVDTMALQTLTKPDGDNPAAMSVRECFIASEGCRLVMADFDQVELRLSGHFSEDPTLVAVLSDLDGPDPFTQFARLIYGDAGIQKKDPRRQLTKNASYADLYGAGDEKFALTAGVPLAQAQAFRQAYHAQFPMLRTFQKDVQREGERMLRDEGEASVRTPYGHRLVCEPDKIYKLVNYKIQGTSANIMKAKLVELDNAGLGPYMVLPVHDEVLFDAPEDLAEEVGRVAGQVMSEMTAYKVPLPVGVDGPFDNWASKYK